MINDYSLSSFDTFKNEKLEDLKNVKYIDLEDRVYKFQLNYDEIIGDLDLKNKKNRLLLKSRYR